MKCWNVKYLVGAKPELFSNSYVEEGSKITLKVCGGNVAAILSKCGGYTKQCGGYAKKCGGYTRFSNNLVKPNLSLVKLG